MSAKHRRTIRLRGVRSSILLEHEFWAYLETARRERELSMTRMVDIIVDGAPVGQRCSAIRVWCLRDAMAVAEHARLEPAQ